jgi:type II secretory ATPase GspE/PulE/Tfp pilus assembly ATPase PilB-like protein
MDTILLSAKEREHAIWRDGVLWVNQTQRRSPVVSSLIANIQKKRDENGRPYEIKYVEPDKLAAIANRKTDDQQLSTAEVEKMQGLAMQLIAEAARLRATDISLNITRDATYIAFRVDGLLDTNPRKESAQWGDALTRGLVQGMTEASSSSHFTPSVPMDAKISRRFELPPGIDEVRVSTLPTLDNYELYLRLQRSQMIKEQSFEELGFSKKDADALRQLTTRTQGLVLFIGPTNSGKTINVYQFLAHIHNAKDGRRITSLEDPPEIRVNWMTQTVINGSTETERTQAYKMLNRAFMRGDLNVLYQSEIRDFDSANSACALTASGHLVTATMHLSNAFDVPKRFLSLGVDEAMLMDNNTLLAAVPSRLVAKLCPHCAISHEKLTDPRKREHARSLVTTYGDSLRFRGLGCSECNQRGTIGRKLIATVIRFDRDIVDALMIKDYALAGMLWRQSGGKTLRNAAVDAMREGVVDPFELHAKVQGFDDAADYPNQQRIDAARRELNARAPGFPTTLERAA